MKIRKTVGIDLGTTNSVIAMLDATDSALITGQDEHGHKTVPSVVGYLPESARPVVGRAAAALKGNAAPPVASVKRHMGLERAFAVGPETLTPPQVSARILLRLRELLAYALNDGSYVFDSAIITMPAYFNHNQIEATRQAGELAGYEVVELLHEPTAAAIYYSWLEGHGDATYLVYDLGGGTFDVSVIRKRFNDYEVLSVSGDPFLGGDDFDRLLASHLLVGMRGQKLEIGEGSADFAKLVHVAEGVKIDLTTHERVERFIPDVLTGADGRPVSLAVDVDRATFQRLIKDKVARTIDCCREALARARDKAGVRLGDIDYLVLVGGSSRVPLVRDTVRAAFCNPSLPEHVRHPEPLLSEPDLCVAYGAALRAATYGTHYLFPDLKRPHSFLPDLDLGLGLEEPPLELEVHVTSPVNVTDTAHTLVGCVRGPGAAEVRHGGSVRVRVHAPLAPRGRGVGGGGGRTATPHPRPLSPEYRGEGGRIGGVPGAGRGLRAGGDTAAGCADRAGADAVRQCGPGAGELPRDRAALRVGASLGAGRVADAAHHQAAANRGAEPGAAARQAGGGPRRRRAARHVRLHLPHRRSVGPHRRADLRGEPRHQADGHPRPRPVAAGRIAGGRGTGHRREAQHPGARAGAGDRPL
jgi:actin-like ATPase involved in cell morphogenesis